MNERDQCPIHQRDRVFNAETCRALRRVSHTPQAVFVTTVILGGVALWALGEFFIQSPSPPLPRLLGIAYFVAVFATGLWAGMPTREARREAKHAVVWSIADIFRRGHTLPPEYQPSADGEDSDPPAVPALAAGRAPLDWAITVGLPAAVALHVVVTREVPLGIALAGCIALGAFLFHRSRGGLMRPTFPPEDPPHDRG